MGRRETELIVAGVGQDDTGQTTLAHVPRWARSAIFQLKWTTEGGTTGLVDYKLAHAIRGITAAPVVSTTQAGDESNDEVQQVTLTGGPTGGVWSLSWTGVSADISATVRGLSATATAAQVQDALNAALPHGSTYLGRDIVVTRTGAGTSGDPYDYIFTFSGATVTETGVDELTVDGSGLYTEAATAENFQGWDGITQLSAPGNVWVQVGPFEADTTDDTGPVYQIQAELPAVLGHVVTLSQADEDEFYDYSIWATYVG